MSGEVDRRGRPLRGAAAEARAEKLKRTGGGVILANTPEQDRGAVSLANRPEDDRDTVTWW